ncbi:MAG TPA: hypothetical protein VGT82_18025 [Ktedonobacteraceae bacterium]|nr:hypothetical protein [Ktedonobacteraceae bacterium]
MSQQEIHSEKIYADGPQGSYSGYEGTQHRSYDNNYSGQKLSGQGMGRRASAGQRLALALVSLILLVIVIFGLVLIAAGTNVEGWVAIPILLIIFLFGAVATIINVVFNRSH